MKKKLSTQHCSVVLSNAQQSYGMHILIYLIANKSNIVRIAQTAIENSIFWVLSSAESVQSLAENTILLNVNMSSWSIFIHVIVRTWIKMQKEDMLILHSLYPLFQCIFCVISLLSSAESLLSHCWVFLRLFFWPKWVKRN